VAWLEEHSMYREGSHPSCFNVGDGGLLGSGYVERRGQMYRLRYRVGKILFTCILLHQPGPSGSQACLNKAR
jgi:hypothetical protein